MSFHLETDRLTMRSFQDSDLEIFVRYRSDPVVAKYQGWDAPYAVDAAARFIQEMKERQPGTKDEWYQIAIELKASAEMIGDCAFHKLPNDGLQAEVGVTLSRQYQGQGYATEALTRLLDYLFTKLELHRVQATCDTENLASARLLERIGMRREGHLHENIWFKGAWGSEYTYAVLKREWEQNSNPRSAA